jgi:quinoprotein glucose dehydrogenase
MEKPVPQNPEPHEHLSPTQPFSAINLQPAVLKESDMWGITPYDQLACRILFKKLRYDGPYTPHSTHGTLQYPGLMGVTEWGGVAVDEQNKVMVVNTSTVPYWPRLLAKDDMKDVASMHGTFSMSAKAEPDEKPRNGFEVFWANMQGPYFASVDAMLGPMKAPCNQPPWGHMVAYDLTTGKELWRREIGTARDSGPFFQPIGLALPIGTPNLGGPLITAGGLVFHAGTLDNYLRAYDVKTGKELWRTRLPAGGQATPMTYVAADGRQYVVIAAGGHGGLRTTQGDYLIAYALPK